MFIVRLKMDRKFDCWHECRKRMDIGGGKNKMDCHIDDDVSSKMGIDLAFKIRLEKKDYGMSVVSMKHNMRKPKKKKIKTEYLAVMREIVTDRTAAGPYETK